MLLIDLSEAPRWSRRTALLHQLKALHNSFGFIQSNFPFWFWQRVDKIWATLMTGNTLVGILLLLFLVRGGN